MLRHACRCPTPDFGNDRNCEEKLCQQECTNLSGTGFICSCRPGYKVDPDSTYTCLGKHTHTHRKVTVMQKSLCMNHNTIKKVLKGATKGIYLIKLKGKSHKGAILSVLTVFSRCFRHR